MEFSYYNPTKIQFGEGKTSSIVNFIDKDKKILIVYGKGSIRKNNVYDEICIALKGYNWFEFSGVEPNPTIETMDKAVAIIREKKIDFVLAVGGGSVIDGCKYLVAASLYDGNGWDFMEGKQEVKKALPLGVILTLPATGSESNSVAVISRKATNEKRFFNSNFVFPVFAILDPRIMTSLSDRQLSNGLIDAFVHVCEQYITYPTKSIVQDGYSETLLKGLLKLSNNWENRRTVEWQDNLMWIANQALNGLIGSGVPQDWATHMIGHELTAFYGMDHAQSLTIIQPHLLRVSIKYKKEKLLQMGQNVFGIKDDANAVIKAIETFYISRGFSINLNSYPVKKDDLARILNSLERHEMINLGENENITLKHCSEILTLAMK